MMTTKSPVQIHLYIEYFWPLLQVASKIVCVFLCVCAPPID